MPLRSTRPQQKKKTYFGSIALYISVFMTLEGLTGLLLCRHRILSSTTNPLYSSGIRYLHVTPPSRMPACPVVMTKDDFHAIT